MKRCLPGFLIVGILLSVMAPIVKADDAKEEAIRKDRQKIEGKWRITALVVNGKTTKEEDARKLTVVNGSDGTWGLRSEQKEISAGTSVFDPTQYPKTIDFTLTKGNGRGGQYLGIYEIGEDTRKLCFASAGQERPTEFSSSPGSGHILVTFERVRIE